MGRAVVLGQFMTKTSNISLIAKLVAELERSLGLVGSLPNHVYRSSAGGSGNIGAHIRHTIDFVDAFLRGIRVGSIDYTDRERDPRLEADQEFARIKIEKVIEQISECSSLDPASLVMVRSEIRPDVRHCSSFSRELEFVYSHALHHHALIKERLAGFGIQAERGLGVAPATQMYWDRYATAA